MTKTIAMDFDRVSRMANDHVREITQMEELHRRMNAKLSELRSQSYSGDPRFFGCVSGALSGDQSQASGSRLIGKLNQSESAIREAATEFAKQDMNFHGIPLTVSELYETYGNTVGRWENLLEYGKYAMFAPLLHYSTGMKFVKVNGQYTVVLRNGIRQAVDWVEGSRANPVARFLINPMTLFKYKDKGMADLIFKSLTKHFASDAIKVSTAMDALKSGIKSATSAGGVFGAIKSNAGTLLKGASKLGKSNALLALALTAGGETIGAGIKIAENYRKYGNNVEVLKRENAKEVGRAIYKTGVVTVAAGAGAVLGGAIGSLGGPVGTVIGAHVGGFVGSLIGEKLAENTPQFVDDLSVKMKDQVYAVTETVADGARAVKDFAGDVKDTASSLWNGAKSLFSKPIWA
ncbi:uncharacterized protein YcfJ [Paenibacillus phyllosphaerae]|uniref:Uncharacterized protein YcfJ n=1 Tax=Paenibacillus phyllosphaerae TaxID=274593 RepID=A0A7W5AYD4_9BACL|nr:glycine zipper domain-containing protein [Paenibacillus phyllosphaerae]MBB3110992.1 uncharacterized protein YcfJ [Paenibacillus phyllosphaerae]